MRGKAHAAMVRAEACAAAMHQCTYSITVYSVLYNNYSDRYYILIIILYINYSDRLPVSGCCLWQPCNISQLWKVPPLTQCLVYKFADMDACLVSTLNSVASPCLPTRLMVQCQTMATGIHVSICLQNLGILDEVRSQMVHMLAERAYQEHCMIVRAAKVTTGMPRCQRVRCSARFAECTSIRQSSERLPLVMEAKAKLTALKSQCTGFGKGILAAPRKVTYCIHKVTPCMSTTYYKLCRLSCIGALHGSSALVQCSSQAVSNSDAINMTDVKKILMSGVLCLA